MPLRHSFLLAAASAVFLGCTEPTPSSPMSDTTFVKVMADLPRLQDSMGGRTDSAMRAAVLRKHKVTADGVEAAARVFAEDPDRASNIWHAINRRANDPGSPRPP